MKNGSGAYLICHDGGHGPANLMVLLTFPYWTQQDKQKSGNTHKGQEYVSKHTEVASYSSLNSRTFLSPITQKSSRTFNKGRQTNDGAIQVALT